MHPFGFSDPFFGSIGRLGQYWCCRSCSDKLGDQVVEASLLKSGLLVVVVVVAAAAVVDVAAAFDAADVIRVGFGLIL